MDDQSKDQPQPEPQPDPRRSFTAGWLFWLFFAFVLYILSIGPAINLLWKKSRATFRPLMTIYSPIAQLCAASEPANKCFHWYLKNIWDVDLYLAPPPPRHPMSR